MKQMKQERTLSVLIFVLTWKISTGSPTPPVITLPQGYVKGITIFSETSTRVNAFLGLPYALPPIGDLRFAPPERHPGWNRTLIAGHFRPDCPQLWHESEQSETYITNEDCLYLNVFVPEVAMIYRNYPVVMFIHGVDYVAGSPLIVNAEEFTKEGLIVVTFSYRLNVFGFLTFEDEFARGNLGLLDQYMAFMWVKENIQYFGGLPNNITLMGHGSGASSILVHMTSPRTKNLFQKAILMSGSILSPWLKSHVRSESHPALLTSRSIARSLGCYGENYHGQKSRSVLACMKQKSSEEIMKAFQSSYQNGNWSNILGPISDDFLLPEKQYLPFDPSEAVRLGRYHPIPILTGITCNEGTITLNNWKELIGQNDESIHYFIKNTAVSNVLQKYNLKAPEVRSLINWNYFEKVPKETKAIYQLLKLYNDALFVAPFWRQTQILSKHNDRLPVFAYVFAHPSFDYIGNYRELLNLTTSVHGSEILFLFGPSLFEKISGRRFTTTEERLSMKMKRLWAYFIRLGDPTPPSYGYSLWDRYDTKSENYLKLFIDYDTGRNLQKVSGIPDKEATTFWNSLLPKLQSATNEKMKKLDELLFLSGASNIGANSAFQNDLSTHKSYLSSWVWMDVDGFLLSDVLFRMILWKSGNAGNIVFRVCSSYKSAMFTTLGFLILLLIMLVLSLVFLKKRTKERDRGIL